jgi:hypothetical protein
VEVPLAEAQREADAGRRAAAGAASRRLAAASPLLELTLPDGVPQIALAGVPWARLEVPPGSRPA